MSTQRRAARRRLRLWMRLSQRCGGISLTRELHRGFRTRRFERYWTRDWDLYSQLDPVVRAQRLRDIEDQEND